MYIVLLTLGFSRLHWIAKFALELVCSGECERAVREHNDVRHGHRGRERAPARGLHRRAVLLHQQPLQLAPLRSSLAAAALIISFALEGIQVLLPVPGLSYMGSATEGNFVNIVGVRRW